MAKHSGEACSGVRQTGVWIQALALTRHVTVEKLLSHLSLSFLICKVGVVRSCLPYSTHGWEGAWTYYNCSVGLTCLAEYS